MTKARQKGVRKLNEMKITKETLLQEMFDGESLKFVCSA